MLLNIINNLIIIAEKYVEKYPFHVKEILVSKSATSGFPLCPLMDRFFAHAQ